MQAIKHFYLILSVLAVFIATSSCFRSSRDSSELAVNINEMDSLQLFVEYKNTVFCIPSPQLVMLTLRNAKVIPDDSLINPATRVDNYATNFQKSLNLGVYGTDIGFININSQSQLTSKYLLAIESLANGLNMGDLINKKTILQIDQKKDNQDSLLLFVNKLFTSADEYLIDNSREQTSSLILAGAWIEEIYILSAIFKKQKRDDVYKLLLHQKFPLEYVIKVLAPYYRQSTEITVLIDKLVNLAYDFEAVDLSITYSTQAISVNKNGFQVNAKNNEKAESKSISTIIKQIAIIRNEITK